MTTQQDGYGMKAAEEHQERKNMQYNQSIRNTITIILGEEGGGQHII
jgi:hypothetical protein